MRFEFPFIMIGSSTMGIFKQAKHGAQLNPGAQVGSQNKDFGAVLQTDLTRVLIRLWRRLDVPVPSLLLK